MNEINDIFGNGFHTSSWHIPSWVVGLLLWFVQEFYGHPLASMLRFHKLGIGHRLLGIWVLVEINDLEVFEWSSLTHLLSSPILRPVNNNSWIWTLYPTKVFTIPWREISPMQLVVVRTNFIRWVGRMVTSRMNYNIFLGEINIASWYKGKHQRSPFLHVVMCFSYAASPNHLYIQCSFVSQNVKLLLGPYIHRSFADTFNYYYIM